VNAWPQMCVSIGATPRRWWRSVSERSLDEVNACLGDHQAVLWRGPDGLTGVWVTL